MANSILKEVTFTPNTFDKNFTLENLKRFYRLLEALNDITDSGIIVGISHQWQKQIDKFIEQYDDCEKSEFQEIFKLLSDRHRIVIYPLNQEFGDNEDNWITQANLINQRRAFDVIVASKESKTTQQIEHIERGTFKNQGAKVSKQTKEFMHNMLSPILSYAEIVKIIDPYFSFEHQRFKDALEIICKNLGNHHGITEDAVMDIQTSIKAMIENKEFKWQLADKWPEIIKYFEKKYGHIITLSIWEEAKEEKWHERWIITNQCGIFIGKGSDISEWTDSTWSLLDWHALADITNKFDTNRETYTYIGSVTSNGIVRNQNPKTTLTFMTDYEKSEERKTMLKKIALDENERLREKETIVTKSGIRKKK